MNILYMTVGLPRSGKTTWAKAQGLPIVNPDSIRLALHGQPFVSSAEPFVWAIAKCMVRSLFLAGHEEVVLDATNTTVARREDWVSKDWIRRFIICDELTDICVERAQQIKDENHRDGLISAIGRMADAYQEPTNDEIRDWEKEAYDNLNDWPRR